MNTIDEFMERYVREFDLHQSAARRVASICEELLRENGISAIVTSRAKRPDTLRDKVKGRNKRKRYATTKSIFKDIVDLSGARIALYFPDDVHDVEKLLRQKFRILRSRRFPRNSSPAKRKSEQYEKVFRGYSARHFNVKIRAEDLNPGEERYSTVPVELQIASVLMHAWAEVEHDLGYKPRNGDLSLDERAILDELNGLVLAGEISLQRLQRAVKSRLAKKGERFRNHYELATYIYDRARTMGDEPIMGRVDILFGFLKLISKNDPRSLDPYLVDFAPDTHQRPIVDQITDRLLKADKKLYAKYAEAKVAAGRRSPFRSVRVEDRELSNDLSAYLRKWILLERYLRKGASREHRQGRFWNFLPNAVLHRHPPEVRRAYHRLRRLRNDLVHSTRAVSGSELAKGIRTLDRLSKVLSRAPSGRF